MNTTKIIGICGCSGSGKTSVAKGLATKFSVNISLLTMDHYYFPKDQQLVDENGIENFDLPTSLDHTRCVEDINKLKRGESVSFSEYVFNNKNINPKKVTIEPSKILIIEGLFIFHVPEIREVLDQKIFIDTNLSLCLQRRMKRDEERGYDENDVLYRFQNHVIPSFNNYIEPYKYDSIIIDGMQTPIQVLGQVITHVM